MRLTVTEEQRAINAEGASKLLAALDAACPPKRKLFRTPTVRDEELFAGMHAIEREARQVALTTEEKVDRLRVLAIAQRKPMETLGEVLARIAPQAQQGEAAE